MQLMHQFYKVSADSFNAEKRNPASAFLVVRLTLDFLTLHWNRNVIELVELSGIEPLTPCVQGRCSPS